MIRTIDLFSGCGGMSLGCIRAGCQIVASVDHWRDAARVYAHNIGVHPIITDLGDDPHIAATLAAYAPTMIIGSPPCQDFSLAGNRNPYGARASLTVVFAEIVTTLRPAWVVMEQVPGVARSSLWLHAKMELVKGGYEIREVILDAAWYGVPQHRKRFFAIGCSGGVPQSVIASLEQSKQAVPMTVRDYVGHDFGIEHYYRHPRTYQRRGVFSIDEPSPTIRGVNRPVPPSYRPHPQDSTTCLGAFRSLTARERSRIQTFPPTFDFCGVSRTAQEQMIGNAVPVQLAFQIACAIRHARG